MTNYRIEMHKNQLPEFKFCMTCGSRLKEDSNDTGTSWVCSKNWVHLRIIINTDEDTEVAFI